MPEAFPRVLLRIELWNCNSVIVEILWYVYSYMYKWPEKVLIQHFVPHLGL